MAMSKKHYTAIAAVLNEWHQSTNNSLGQLTIELLAGDLANVFATDNPNFDRARFIEAVSTRKEQ